MKDGASYPPSRCIYLSPVLRRRCLVVNNILIAAWVPIRCEQSMPNSPFLSFRIAICATPSNVLAPQKPFPPTLFLHLLYLPTLVSCNCLFCFPILYGVSYSGYLVIVFPLLAGPACMLCREHRGRKCGGKVEVYSTARRLL